MFHFVLRLHSESDILVVNGQKNMNSKSLLFLKWKYRSVTVNLNTVNSKFHLIRSYCKYLATILSIHVYNERLIQMQLIQSSTNSKGI